jgi:hypothetical protein
LDTALVGQRPKGAWLMEANDTLTIRHQEDHRAVNAAARRKVPINDPVRGPATRICRALADGEEIRDGLS